MARLIDDDKLIHALCKDYTTGKKTLGQVIDEQPTAFDVDKVVEQLDAYITKLVGRNAALYKTVMQIVKGGGVDVR